MFSLDDYSKKKNEILSDDKLSQKGKSEALARLEQRSKDDARKSIKALRKEAVVNALSLKKAQSERLEKVKEAQAKIDYARLNYEAQAIRSKIQASDSLSDVLELWESVKGSGDGYALKAFKDTSQGLINEKFGDDYSNLKGSLFDEMSETLVEITRVEMSDDEIKARDALRKIESEASEISEAFGSGQAVVKRVFDGIAFDAGKVELGFDYGVHKLTDEKETESEVAFRLEREREKALENYKKTMSEVGFDDILDGDFDDLRGALD